MVVFVNIVSVRFVLVMILLMVSGWVVFVF